MFRGQPSVAIVAPSVCHAFFSHDLSRHPATSGGQAIEMHSDALFSDEAVNLFSHLDADHDGTVSRQEWDDAFSFRKQWFLKIE